MARTPDIADCKKLISWPEGSKGYVEEFSLISHLLTLCKKHGYGRVAQLMKGIEDIWHDLEEKDKELIPRNAIVVLLKQTSCHDGSSGSRPIKVGTVGRVLGYRIEQDNSQSLLVKFKGASWPRHTPADCVRMATKAEETKTHP